ncbi:ATP-dependent helicase, partial [Patescibacteria group bacterium]|nr:ATP-dependent helicase [Patescibacteria group bacterium]
MSHFREAFDQSYKGLNPEQKRAVDTTEGPVMVIAGPGTGKTQVLALRIAHIMDSTDTPPSGILCLTFTRAGVTAMRERLVRYIGNRASEVRVTTFHSYAASLVEKYFELLDFESAPTLLDDQSAVVLIDELLERQTWQYLRPRGNSVKYFSDLKSLISLLKRERLTAESFLAEVERDITALEESPDSISTRGPSKGQLKKEVIKAIEGLERTKEVVTFYQHYEYLKRERGLMDYDDVLEYAVTLVEISDDVCAEIRENALYVHVDEHQDSSGVQNSFLQAVWQDIEQPNIFVVGDDRQLIYGFGGASLSYFEQFKTTFGKATLITLIQNYRSTATILSVADEMQKSSLTTELLQSNREETYPVVVSEYNYPRDEIIAAGAYFKAQIAAGIPAEECALLLPKNKHVRTAAQILRGMGFSVRASTTVSLFSVPETAMFRRVLNSITEPFSGDAIANTLFDPVSQIPPLVAHRFIHEHGTRNLSLETLLAENGDPELFAEQDSVRVWGKTLAGWVSISTTTQLELLIQIIGNQLLIDTAPTHEILVRRVEVVRTVIHLVTSFIDKNDTPTLVGFIEYLDRLERYGHNISIAVLDGTKGISVLTLHGSKGLEYDSVWIAHMNESVLMSGKKAGFALPESVESRIEA